MSEPKVPTEDSVWWREGCASPVRVIDAGDHGAPSLRFWTMALPGTYAVTDDGHWLAPVLTPAEAAALTADRDEARRWAEAAAADENANAAELREARATLDAVAALVGGGDVVERVRALLPVVWCGPWESVTGRRRLWFNNEAGDLDSLAASVGDAGWLVWTGKGQDCVQCSGPETGAKGERACIDALRSCGVEVRE